MLAMQEVIQNSNKKLWKELLRINCSYSAIFIHTYAMMFATRQALDIYRNDFVKDLRKDYKFLRNKPEAAKILVSFCFCVPWGWSANFIFTQRFIKGTFSLTLLQALFMNMIVDKAQQEQYKI